ncbi:hypothetical protein ACLOJK_017748 [Asimina triloba]
MPVWMAREEKASKQDKEAIQCRTPKKSYCLLSQLRVTEAAYGNVSLRREKLLEIRFFAQFQRGIARECRRRRRRCHGMHSLPLRRDASEARSARWAALPRKVPLCQKLAARSDGWHTRKNGGA